MRGDRDRLPLPEPERLTLLPRRWVALPGTGFEVMLHGRMPETGAMGTPGVMVERGRGPAVLGGWDLSPVFGMSYLRRRPGGGRGG